MSTPCCVSPGKFCPALEFHFDRTITMMPAFCVDDICNVAKASLMDQDLSLMKQLLTLNEEIEELKWRRRYAWSKNSMASSGDMESNDWTESDVSMCIPETDIPQKYPSPSSLSLQETHSASFYDDSDPCGTFNRSKAKSKIQTLLSKKSSFNERGSFDSGIHVGFNDSPTNTAERTTRVTQL
ncbi:hypothetical protein LOTGIDRAFT_174598 [Lottia gigantea]|uniref:Uncharacterized protein n=1 Tax=Lottia gigantea TaxID=225164 RepID=V4ATN7_LOTGI|nr:hypothetical protein LOTGIDRAFT_174598 [Lottia gigantea]ESO97116.1 hypothetical protein LOTGIDRAFT_174598 [Lottia gigantea]